MSIVKTESVAGDPDDIEDQEDYADFQHDLANYNYGAASAAQFNGSILGSRSFADPKSYPGDPRHEPIATPVRGRELLTLTVDLGEEGRENILIFENDHPEHIAQNFCLKHNIDEKLKEMLISHISANMEQVRSEIIAEQRGGSIRSAVDAAIDPIQSPGPLTQPYMRS